jgi:hypothetical protein
VVLREIAYKGLLKIGFAYKMVLKGGFLEMLHKVVLKGGLLENAD